MKNEGRGLVGRHVRVIGARSRRITRIDRVISKKDGSVRLEHPIDGLLYWNTDALRFLRGDYRERA